MAKTRPTSTTTVSQTASSIGGMGIGTAGDFYPSTWVTTDSHTKIASSGEPGNVYARDVTVSGEIYDRDGVSLSHKLDRIERALALPEEIANHPIRRAAHKKLQKLYEEYQETEKKLQMWEAIQGDYPDTTKK